MNRNTFFVAAALIIFLVVAVGFTFHVWTNIGADPAAGGGGEMNGNGITALIIGGIGSLVLGAGLMALVFFSARRGYDDAADPKGRQDQDP